MKTSPAPPSPIRASEAASSVPRAGDDPSRTSPIASPAPVRSASRLRWTKTVVVTATLHNAPMKRLTDSSPSKDPSQEYTHQARANHRVARSGVPSLVTRVRGSGARPERARAYATRGADRAAPFRLPSAAKIAIKRKTDVPVDPKRRTSDFLLIAIFAALGSLN